MSTDEQIQERYHEYCDKFKGMHCPECNHPLMVTITQGYNESDDLISSVQLNCSQCHWSTKIDRLYSECVE